MRKSLWHLVKTKDFPLTASHKERAEKLWREFFADPSSWCDHRADKVNARYPDFKNRKTGDSLWVDSQLKPPWVEAELAAMQPGALQVNPFTWNKRLSRYAKAGQNTKTLSLFKQMHREGINPDKFTFFPVLDACSSLGALDEGRRIHLQIIQTGYDSDIYIHSCLVDMYAKCGSIDDAQMVFNEMPARNVVVWNAMILGHVKCGQEQEAWNLFQKMQQEGVEPSSVTFVGIINACARLAALKEGRHIHQQVIQRGWESEGFVGNSLLDMYVKCGSIDDAQRVFQKMPSCDVVAWSTMILGHVKCGQGHEALDLFSQMEQRGVDPDPGTFVGVLNACANVLALGEGRRVHQQIIQRGWESNAFVASSLVNMYAKCKRIEDAERAFQKMRTRDVVAWSAMILGYVTCGEGRKALEQFREMQQEGVDPDPVTFVSVLNACAATVAIEEGRRVHEKLIARGWESDVFVGSSLVDMYAKCGSVEEARGVFKKMPTHNVVSWNAMLAGYALHGHWEESFKHYERMRQERVVMNGVTFLSLMSACNHGGLVNEGLHYFESMGSVENLSPTVDHYACLVDLLARAGHLHQAEDLTSNMSCEANASIWRSLLRACRVHGNVDMGERAAERLLQLDPENAAGYVLLSNIYAAAGQWDSSVDVQRDRLQENSSANTDRGRFAVMQ